MIRHRLTFITPLFSNGSYDDRPEIRPPSIRGQLHWWFRALGGSASDENIIFGGVQSDPVASKIVVRVGGVTGQTGQINTLPHKQGGQASPKWAYQAGAAFDLIITERLGGLNEPQRADFQHTLETWLHIGTLGLRATRASGSFTWDASPKTFAEYKKRIGELVNGTRLKAALLAEQFNSAEEARKIVSDTLGGRNDQHGDQSLRNIRYPLGGIGRDIGGRKTSPLRFRIVKIGNQFHIAAVWDDRENVTHNRPDDLQGIVQLLAQRKPKLGKLLVAAFP